MKMRISYCIVLAILLGAQLSNAALDQATLLRQFLESRAQQSADMPDENDPWADPATSFGHLPERCKTLPKGSKEADRIVAWPGQSPRVNFDQYASSSTTSPRPLTARPLSHSSFGSTEDRDARRWAPGAMMELGPFRVNPDGKTLNRNRYAWNNVANVIFLESPAGVGFSYSNTTSDYNKSGDGRTASDTYTFLLNWLERFPEYKGRDFYVAGESYAGHYVPELARVIVYLREFTGKNPINLKGIIVGNPYLDHYKNRKGGLEFLWNHGVISNEVWADITEHCKFGPSDGLLCAKAKSSFQAGDIDYYNIYAPICMTSSNGTSYSSSYLPGYDPCIDNYVDVYFNNPEVQKAIHARSNTSWSGCTDLPWNDAPLTMMPMISWLVDAGLRVWIYSGNMDDVCPITATRYSIKDLNLTVTKPWRPWYTPDNEVGGYVQQYDGGFTFASVRGSGHLVPSFQPKRSLVLLYSFLKGMLPPAVSVWRP